MYGEQYINIKRIILISMHIYYSSPWREFVHNNKTLNVVSHAGSPKISCTK